MRSIRSLSVFGLSTLISLTAFSPIASAEGPATRPADDSGRVLVLPFKSLNPSPYQGWLGRSIQQSLLADLTTAAPDRAMSADVEPTDATGAIEAARKAGARYVVDGSFVISGQDLRLTGQLLDVNTGNAVAGLKATGPANDVFRLEDQIAAEVRQKLALGRPVMQNPYAPENPTGAGVQAPAQPTNPEQGYYTAVAPQSPPVENYYNSYYYDNTTPAYGYGYDNGYYGYGYPFYPFYGGVFVYGGGGYYHHHGYDHDGYGRGGHYSGGGGYTSRGGGFGGHVGGSFGGGHAGGGIGGHAGGGHR